MAWTQERLDRLRAAYQTGAIEVSIGDERIKYVSRAEMLATIREGEAALEGRNRPAFLLAGFSRGDR
jgi:hypothetical protein